MTISALRAAYVSGRTTPREVIEQAHERIASDAYYCAWIHVLDERAEASVGVVNVIASAIQSDPP